MAQQDNSRGFVEIEKNFYIDNTGKVTMFFSREDIDRFFKDFKFSYLEDSFKHRMSKNKGAWKFVGRNEKV